MLSVFNLTSMSVALTVPFCCKTPSTSTVLPTAGLPSSCSIRVLEVTWTVRRPTTQSPMNPAVLGRLEMTPVNSNSSSSLARTGHEANALNKKTTLRVHTSRLIFGLDIIPSSLVRILLTKVIVLANNTAGKVRRV